MPGHVLSSLFFKIRAEADNARSGLGRHMHGLGSARNGVDEPEVATDPDAGPLVGATVLVAVLGPARSDCAKKNGGWGDKTCSKS